MDIKLIERLTQNRFPAVEFTFNHFSEAQLAEIQVALRAADPHIQSVSFQGNTAQVNGPILQDIYLESDLIFEALTDTLGGMDTDVIHHEVINITDHQSRNIIWITINLIQP